MAYDEFKQAISQGQGAKTPASPLGSFPDIAALFQSQFQLGESSAPVAGMVGTAATDDANARAAAEAARRKEAAALKSKIEDATQKIKDYQNPSKWQQVQKDDGGYDYYDPLGNRVSIAQYAEVQGKRPHELLEKSQNSLDQQFVNEYGLLKDYTQAVYAGDLEKVEKLKENPVLGDIAKELDSTTPEAMWKSFIEYYDNYFNPDNVNAAPRGNIRNYGPQEEEDNRGLFKRIFDLANPLG